MSMKSATSALAEMLKTKNPTSRHVATVASTCFTTVKEHKLPYNQFKEIVARAKAQSHFEFMTVDQRRQGNTNLKMVTESFNKLLRATKKHTS